VAAGRSRGLKRMAHEASDLLVSGRPVRPEGDDSRLRRRMTSVSFSPPAVLLPRCPRDRPVYGMQVLTSSLLRVLELLGKLFFLSLPSAEVEGAPLFPFESISIWWPFQPRQGLVLHLFVLSLPPRGLTGFSWLFPVSRIGVLSHPLSSFEPSFLASPVALSTDGYVTFSPFFSLNPRTRILG